MAGHKWFHETLHREVALEVRVDRVVIDERTEFQDLLIFENERLGRVLALDGALQTTEKDEFTYHEMMAHVPIVSHGRVERVLIIGGGDGGVLRECLKHPGLEATQIEIDSQVVRRCKEHLPWISRGGFDDPRTRLIVADGAEYIGQTEDRFEVIIVDSTDPGGPSLPLFSEKFYARCKQCLTTGGILVTQSGTPFFQPRETRTSYQGFGSVFADATFYTACVPTYIGGHLAIGWGSDDPSVRAVSLTTLRERVEAIGLETFYYTPELHLASFVLPKYFFSLMTKD